MKLIPALLPGAKFSLKEAFLCYQQAFLIYSSPNYSYTLTIPYFVCLGLEKTADSVMSTYVSRCVLLDPIFSRNCMGKFSTIFLYPKYVST